MPCYDGRDIERSKHFDELTRYLCALLTEAERAGFDGGLIANAERAKGILPGEISRWWANHKEFDKKRK